MIYLYKNEQIEIKRYPKTKNSSLRAWNAADEYIVRFINDIDLDNKNIAICNDRFGFLSCLFQENKPTNVCLYKSQEKSCVRNFENNSLNVENVNFINPLSKTFEKIDVGIVKIPKSLDLFRLYLKNLAENLNDNATVICGFMTKYFSPQILSIASEYFENVEQGKAWKKSRLLFLNNIKSIPKTSIINTIKIGNEQTIKQYFGVFSSEKIDNATQFLVENLLVQESDKNILDLGSGNGIISKVINEKYPQNIIHLIDDCYLAIESSKMNIEGENIHFYHNDDLKNFENNYFDFVISNPPFHFEYEINIEVPISLFRQVARCLKVDGKFQLVANQHLNYLTHLVKYFQEVNIIIENEKYIIYECIKRDETIDNNILEF